MKATWKGRKIAEAPGEEVISIEGNWYFPPKSVEAAHLRESPTPYTCPWKGACQYFDVVVDGEVAKDNAWSYPQLLPSAVERVGKDFAGYVAFWREVVVEE